LAVFATGKRSNAILPTLLPRFRLAFREIPGTIPLCVLPGDWRVIPMPGSVAGPGPARPLARPSPLVEEHSA